MKCSVLIVLLVVLPLLSSLPVIAQSGSPVITPENADQVTQVAILDRGWINQITWSADGSTLAIAAPSGVWLTDLDSDFRLLSLNSEALSLAYSASGTNLAVGTASGTVEIVDLITGRIASTIQCADTWISDVAMSPDGSLVGCASERGSYAGLWSVLDGSELHVWGKNSGPVAFPASDLFGVGTMLVDVETLEPVASIRTDTSLGDVVFGPHGSTIAAVNHLGEIEVLDVVTQEQRLLLETGTSQVRPHLAVSPSGRQLAVNVFNEKWGAALLLIDMTTGDVQQVLETPDPIVLDTAYSPDGTMVAAATTAGRILVWTLSSGEISYEVTGFNQGGAWRGGASSDISGPTCLAFSPAGLLAVGTGGYVSTSGAVHVWKPTTLEQEHVFLGEGTVWSLAYGPDGSLIAISNAIDGLRLLEADSGETLSTLDTPGDVVDVAFSPDGTQMVVVYSDGSAQLWDVSTGEPGVLQVSTHKAVSGGSVAFSPTGRMAAFGNLLWDTTTGALQELEVAERYITDLAFSPDGIQLATASEDGIQLWDVTSGELLSTFQGMGSVAFSPDGTILASGADAGSMVLWDLATGEARQTLSGHTSTVHSLAFSPDGTLLASASFDGTSRLWAVQ